MLFDHFDRVRIVDLRQQAADRAELLTELSRLGTDENTAVNVVDAHWFDVPEGFGSIDARVAFHSHLAVLDEAATAGESVLIIEHDADLTPSFRALTLPDDWRIVHGGNTAVTRWIGVHAETVPLLVTFLHDLLEQPGTPSIEHAYAAFRRAHPQLVAVAAEPSPSPRRADVAAGPRGSFGMREAVLLGVGGVAIAYALVAVLT